jgi:RHS repeat-associated protein
MTRAGAIYQIDNDHLGRPELITNASKTIVWQSNNDPFGGMTTTTNTLGEFNIGLPGQYFDAESNYWYNVNRYYVPAIGRYLQADPVGLAGGLNPYVYVYNNPVNIIDRDGKNPLLIIAGGAAVGGVGAMIGTKLSGGTWSAAFAAFPGGALSGAAAVTTAMVGGMTAIGVGAGIILDLGITLGLDAIDAASVTEPMPLPPAVDPEQCPDK